jgi:hypothetical protein
LPLISAHYGSQKPFLDSAHAYHTVGPRSSQPYTIARQNRRPSLWLIAQARCTRPVREYRSGRCRCRCSAGRTLLSVSHTVCPGCNRTRPSKFTQRAVEVRAQHGTAVCRTQTPTSLSSTALFRFTAQLLASPCDSAPAHHAALCANSSSLCAVAQQAISKALQQQQRLHCNHIDPLWSPFSRGRRPVCSQIHSGVYPPLPCSNYPARSQNHCAYAAPGGLDKRRLAALLTTSPLFT